MAMGIESLSFHMGRVASAQIGAHAKANIMTDPIIRIRIHYIDEGVESLDGRGELQGLGFVVFLSQIYALFIVPFEIVAVYGHVLVVRLGAEGPVGLVDIDAFGSVIVLLPVFRRYAACTSL